MFFISSVYLSYSALINPLVPSVLNIGPLTNNLISIKEGIIKKNSYGPMSR